VCFHRLRHRHHRIQEYFYFSFAHAEDEVWHPSMLPSGDEGGECILKMLSAGSGKDY